MTSAGAHTPAATRKADVARNKVTGTRTQAHSNNRKRVDRSDRGNEKTDGLGTAFYPLFCLLAGYGSGAPANSLEPCRAPGGQCDRPLEARRTTLSSITARWSESRSHLQSPRCLARSPRSSPHVRGRYHCLHP